MKFNRASGVLLHPTSLPGPYGIGEIGPEACRFADFLQATGQHIWQILPLGPTSFGDSPYQSPSTFAGNPLWISFDLLIKDRLLSRSQLKNFPVFSADRVDFGPVIEARMALLKKVCATFSEKSTAEIQAGFAAFCARNADWLDDYA